jgi:hypothetical protein
MGVICTDQYTFKVISCSILFRMRGVSDRIVKTMKTHIICSITFFFYCRVGQATDYNVVHVHCVLDN